jgi:hypothetical protein
MKEFPNPFRQGAGQLPPTLAGRQKEIDLFTNVILTQSPVLTNLVITGLKGVGKTVLLDTIKPIALKSGWSWGGADLSESINTEEKLALRIITDLAASIPPIIGNDTKSEIQSHFISLLKVFVGTPGLQNDKLKAVCEHAWEQIKPSAKGIVLAYDEAQNLNDGKGERPLTLLLEVFQYLQKKQLPFILILTGLPNLYPNLIERRTFAERMFKVMLLGNLSREASRQAITEPIERDVCQVTMSESAINQVIELSGGYPYFIQYLCKEAYDIFLQRVSMSGDEEPNSVIDFESIVRKLDADYYYGRWNNVTDKQRELLTFISKLDTRDQEFTLKEIESQFESLNRKISSSNLNQALQKLCEAGITYKTRQGKYSFAIPMFYGFVNRQIESQDIIRNSYPDL